MNQKLLRDQLRGHQVLEYLLTMREVAQSREVLRSSERAMGDLVAQYSGSCLVTGQNRANEITSNSSLARSLWQGLQITLLAAVSNIELLESAISGVAPVASASGSNFVDEGGLFRMVDTGRLSLNLGTLGRLG